MVVKGLQIGHRIVVVFLLAVFSADAFVEQVDIRRHPGFHHHGYAQGQQFVDAGVPADNGLCDGISGPGCYLLFHPLQFDACSIIYGKVCTKRLLLLNVYDIPGSYSCSICRSAIVCCLNLA